MNKEALYHDVESEYVYPVAKDRLVVRLRTAKNDVSSVTLYYIDKYRYLFWKEHTVNEIVMTRSGCDGLFDYYETEIAYMMNSMGYYFKLEHGTEVLYYGNNLVYDTPDSVDGVCYLDRMFVHALVDQYDVFTVPEWAGESIVYQIFPERFHRGENYTPDPEHGDWYGPVTGQIYLGGTLQGVIDKLDYLVDLGINTIYFNPVFTAWGNHKYVVNDYYSIDPVFGTEETFRTLVKKCHDAGIRVVLDGAFSSTGPDFFAFKNILEDQENSPYKEWYHIKSFPVSTTVPAPYKAFAYYPLLPKLNFSSKAVRDFVLEVMEYWVREFDIDGWRLDSANEIPHHFWQEARVRIKEIKPDILLIGEIWYDSRSWLSGNEMDTVMNYMFFTPVLDYIAHDKITAAEFIDNISKYLCIYKKQVHKTLWNLIGSHDTSRFLHESQGDINRLQCASLLQFTMVGSPTVYYGDELGMSGANDPHCRGGMVWDETKQNKDLHTWYKKLITLRKTHTALIHGTFTPILADDRRNCIGFIRKDDTEEIHVYLNMSETEQTIRTYCSMENLLEGGTADDPVVLPPKSGVVLKKR